MEESLYNPGFKPVEFEGFKKGAGLNSFALTPRQWIEKTGAVGILLKPGRYGGTFAHKDIAFEFASWISVLVWGFYATLFVLLELVRSVVLSNRGLTQV